jgi:selenocysteine lyase/cysteine desulfurase
MTFDLGPWLEQFPVREQGLYLDHAAVCPLPRTVAEAMRQRVTDQEHHGHEHSRSWRTSTLTCRHLGGQLMGCASEDVSLIRSTSEGLSLIAEGLQLGTDDEVLLGEEEFAANVAPWLNLGSLGVTVTRYPQPDGRLDVDAVGELLNERSRVLSVSWVAFHTGWIAPLAQLGRLCRDNGTVLVVDAIQGLGVLPMDMRTLAVDAVVADSHKWLLGPEGIGLMATTAALRSRLRPVLSGWRNVQLGQGDYFMDRCAHFEDGRKLEPGARNEVGIAGLAAALDLIHAVGRDNVQARVEVLARLLTRILIAHGWDVLSPGSGHPIAGIVAARHPTVPAAEAVRRLRERRVVCSTRQGYVRLSPHFYVTRGELEAFDRILDKVGL